MSRRIALVALGLALGLPSTSHAQLGGLIKKAREKVAPAPAAESTDQPARLPGPEITTDVIDHFLAGLQAEKDARDRSAHAEEKRRSKVSEPHEDPQERYNNCLSDRQTHDPKYPELEKLGKDGQAAAQRGDNSKAMEYALQLQALSQGLMQRAESACVSVKPGAAPEPTPEQDAIQNAPTESPEASGAKAAGMTRVQYGQVKELLYTYLGYGNRAGVTANEKLVIEARRAQLREGLASIGMN